MLGVAPELTCCVDCGKSAEQIKTRSFSVSGGGIVCDECAVQEKTNANSLIYQPAFDIINVFRYFESKPLKTFERVDLKQDVIKEVNKILAAYIERYLGAEVLRKQSGLGLYSIEKPSADIQAK
jgi:DNA repair protein RecO (recombination protein O)